MYTTTRVCLYHPATRVWCYPWTQSFGYKPHAHKAVHIMYELRCVDRVSIWQSLLTLLIYKLFSIILTMFPIISVKYGHCMLMTSFPYYNEIIIFLLTPISHDLWWGKVVLILIVCSCNACRCMTNLALVRRSHTPLFYGRLVGCGSRAKCPAAPVSSRRIVAGVRAPALAPMGRFG